MNNSSIRISEMPRKMKGFGPGMVRTLLGKYNHLSLERGVDVFERVGIVGGDGCQP